MARVTSFTAERMLAIENSTVVDGEISDSGRLILVRRDGQLIDAGEVVGAAGAAGSGVSDIVVEYQAYHSGTGNPPGAWLPNPPSVPPGHYLWIRSTITYRDPLDETKFFTTESFQVIRQGVVGEDGVGIQNGITEYQLSFSGDTPPTGTWTLTVPPIIAGRFLWTKTTFSYTDGRSDVLYSVAKQGADGAPGEDGADTYLHVAYATAADGSTGFSTTDPSGRTHMGTYSDRIAADSSDPSDYTWVLIKGTTGTGISSTEVRYQAHTSGTNAPTGMWTEEIPDVLEGDFLWTRTIINFSDGASQTSYAVAKQGAAGADGEDGIGIESTEIRYQQSASGVNPPIGTWAVAPMDILPGRFMWTKTTTTYTNGLVDVAYSVARQGENGENGTPGESSYIHVAYANSADGTENFSVSDPSGRAYMGTYTSQVEADSEDPTDYKWVLIKGASGEGIVGTEIAYNTSASGTTTPTSGWTPGIPVVQPGDFLWTRTTITFTDGGVQTSYTIAKQGMDGSDGIDGEDGSDGSDGIDGASIATLTTYYLLNSGDKPAKPTVRIPPSPWVDEEPAYVPNRTLWTATRAEYTDNRFTWTSVSKMSSYTAASEANDKAIAAQTSADGKSVVSQSTTPKSEFADGSAGDIHWVRDTATNAIIQQQQHNGIVWEDIEFNHQVIASVDIGKGVFGELDGQYIKSETIESTKLKVGDFSNYIQNPTPRGPEGWQLVGAVDLPPYEFPARNEILNPKPTSASNWLGSGATLNHSTSADGVDQLEVLHNGDTANCYVRPVHGISSVEGTWMSFAVDVRPLSQWDADEMRLVMRWDGGSNVIFNRPVPMGTFTRISAAIFVGASGVLLRPQVWPSNRQEDRAGFIVRRASIAIGDSEQAALAQVQLPEYFRYRWLGDPNASESVMELAGTGMGVRRSLLSNPDPEVASGWVSGTGVTTSGGVGFRDVLFGSNYNTNVSFLRSAQTNAYMGPVIGTTYSTRVGVQNLSDWSIPLRTGFIRSSANIPYLYGETVTLAPGEYRELDSNYTFEAAFGDRLRVGLSSGADFNVPAGSLLRVFNGWTVEATSAEAEVRRNRVSNPIGPGAPTSGSTGLGWRPSPSDPHTFIVDGGQPAYEVVQSAAGGSLYVDPNQNFTANVGDTIRFSIDVKTNSQAVADTTRLTISPYSGAANSYIASTTPIPVNEWTRLSVSGVVTAAPEGGYFRTLVWPTVSPPQGDYLRVRRAVVEIGTDLHPDTDFFDGYTTPKTVVDVLDHPGVGYRDGDSPGWVWDDTPGNSASRAREITVVTFPAAGEGKITNDLVLNVREGQRLTLGAELRMNITTAAGFRVVDRDGNVIADLPIDPANPTDTPQEYDADDNPLPIPEPDYTDWVLAYTEWEVPEDVTQVRYEFYSEATSGLFQARNFGFRRKVHGELLVDGTISGRAIKADSIDTPHMRAGAVSTEILAADAVTATNIAAGAINAAHVEAHSLTTDQVSPTFGQDLDLTANNAVNIVVGQMEAVESEFGVIKGEFTDIQAHYRFSEDDLTISKPGSPYEVKISNDRLSIWVHNVEVSHWSEDAMHTSNFVGDSVQLANHTLDTLGESGTIIRWKGSN